MTKEQKKWNLEEIYKNEEERNKEIEEVYTLLEEIQKYDGKLIQKEEILKCYQIYEELLEKCEKIYGYSMLRHHLNIVDTEGMQLFKEAEKIYSDFAERTSFIEPQLTKLEEPVLKELINSKELKEYKQAIEDILENKKHILSEEVEKILASYTQVFNVSENTYGILNDAELTFSKIKTKQGEQELTQANYSIFMADKQIDIRKQAFRNMYETYKKYNHTIAELYLARVKEYVITSKLRGYLSSLERAVKQDDASLKVYDMLIKSVNKNIQSNHKYMRVKKDLLKQDKIHIYDLYMNPFVQKKENVPYEEAIKIVIEALKPLGEEYNKLLQQAFGNRWLDVEVYPNKRSGAYSMGIYGVHPYILLNYTNTNRDVSTVAHEIGHSIHSYYSNKMQNVLNANYTIMVAGSFYSKRNSIKSLLYSKETDRQKKKALLYELIEMIRATLIRQAMFAEFEKDVHERVAKGETLTAENLNEIYYTLNKSYFGEDQGMVLEDEIKYEWSRIPHFYSCFYVYKYATGVSAAISIASKILKGEEGYNQKYIEMLKQGRTKKSIELLKMVNVDLETSTPYEDAFQFYKEKIKELEALEK